MKINEKLGIPEELNKEAIKIYKSIMKDIDSLSSDISNIIDNDNNNEIVVSNIDLNMGNIKMSIRFLLNLEKIEFNDDTKCDIISLGYRSPNYFDDKSKHIKYISNYKKSQLLVTIGFSNDAKPDDIIKVFKKIKTSSIAHELKHLHDASNLKDPSVYNQVFYNSIIQIGGLPRLLSGFLHLLYYMTSTENSVRPVEMYQNLIDKGVDKNEFYNTVKDSDIMKNINKSINFRISELKNELNADKDVENFLIFLEKEHNYKRKGDVADSVLNFLFINISNRTIENADRILSSYARPTFKEMFSDESSSLDRKVDKANVEFEKIISYHRKYIDNNKVEKYFLDIEKKLIFEGNKLKKKIYKLYDMMEDKKDVKDIKSVKNWELHTKINSKNEELVYTLDFDKFKKIGSTTKKDSN